MLVNGLRTGAVFAVASGLSFLSTLELPVGAHWLRLVVGSATVLVVAGAIALVWPSFRRDLVTLMRLRKHFRRGTRTSGDVQPAPTEQARHEDRLPVGAPGQEPADAPTGN
jgi:PST family polysaccharide transporter